MKIPSVDTGSSYPKALSGSTFGIPFEPPSTFSPRTLSLLEMKTVNAWKKNSVTIAR